MTILVSLVGGSGVYEFGPEHDDERVRWEIGEHGQLAIIKQVLDPMRAVWVDGSVLRVFNANYWADIEIV